MPPIIRTALLALLAGACADAAGPSPVATVTVTPALASAWVGDSVALTAAARAADGSPLPDRTVTWHSDDPAVAAVDGAGRVLAVGAGAATISATVEGLSAEATVTVAALDLVVEGDVGSGPELFRIPLDGGAPERLLPPGTVVMDPAMSPDGSRIAFVVADYHDATGDVWVVNRDGTGLRRITDAGALDDAPAWSPDGEWIAFRTFRSESLGEIWIVRGDGSGLANLTPQPGGAAIDNHRPAWSPDGSRIAYASTAGGDWGIWTMRSDGGDRRQLTDTEDLDTEPAWSRDGTAIAFRRSGPTYGSDIMLVPAAGGEPVRLGLAGEQRQPAWSPDGRLLAFVSVAATGEPPELFTMRPDGTDVRRRTAASSWGAALHPSWGRAP